MWNKKSRFTILVEAFTPDLYRYACWVAGDSHVAEDLVQETFTRAWRSLDALRDERSAKARLFTTLRRENARRFARKTLERVDIDVDTLEAWNTLEYGPEARALNRAMQDLASEYRDPLLLQVLGGFTVEEIAQEMDLSGPSQPGCFAPDRSYGRYWTTTISTRKHSTNGLFKFQTFTADVSAKCR